MNSLAVKIAEYVGAETWKKARQLIEAAPELLSTEASDLLFQLVELNRQQNDHSKSEIYQERLKLLQECRELGIDRAFANLTIASQAIAIPDALKGEVARAKETYKKFQFSNSLADLDQSIDHSLILLDKCDHVEVPIDFKINMQSDVAGMYLRRYWFTSNQDDLNNAINLWQEAKKQLWPGANGQDSILNNLGTGLSALYERNGDIGDLDAALECYQKAYEISTKDSIYRDAYAGNLGNAFRDRYKITGNMAHLESAINAYQIALKESPSASPNLAMHHNNLATVFADKYDLTGSADDLDQAIQQWETAIALANPNSPDLAMYFSNLAVGLGDRFDDRGERDDLDKSVEYHYKAVETTSPTSIHKPGYLSNLGNILWRRYKITGDLLDLTNALDACQKAVNLTPSTSLEMPGHLTNLGNVLSSQYDLAGDIKILEETIRSWVQAVKLTPTTSAALPDYLSNLASGLYYRYKRLENTDDLYEAIKQVTQALQLSSQNSFLRAKLYNNLGNYLHARFKKDKDRKDLNDAISKHKEALRLSATGTSNWLLYLSNLLVTLYSRYEITHDLKDLDFLIKSWKIIVLFTHADSPNRPAKMNTLGSLLWERYKQTGSTNDLGEGISAFEEACQKGLEKSSEEALKSAKNWGNWALERQEWAEGVRAFEYAYKAIDQLVEMQFIRVHKEAWLQEAQSIPSRAAYCLAKSGDLSGAVAYLEMGRNRILIEALEKGRQDLKQLTVIGHKDLYEHYRDASARLVVEESNHSNQLNTSQDADRSISGNSMRHSTKDELKSLIDEIRKVVGFNDFLSPWSFSEIVKNLYDETLVYLLVTPAGGVALIIHKGSIRSIWLEVIDKQLREILIGKEGASVPDGYLPAQLGWVPMKPTLDRILPWLGEKVAGPLATVLRLLGVSKVTLIPVGRIALLPIHSAFYSRNGIPIILIDEFSVTYAPSARVLYHCLHSIRGLSSPEMRLLAVGDSEPSSLEISPLQYSRYEIKEIEGFFGANATVLVGKEATREAVINALGKADHIHFSCHASFEHQSPLDSGLLLSNKDRLTLNDIIMFNGFDKARLATLSACQTAIIDFDKLPEESVGLPAGFLQAGVPGVIGSLWQVDDISTAFLMIHFYRHYLSSRSPAESLRHAQLWLKDVQNRELKDYIKNYLPEYGSQIKIPQADSIYKRLVLEDDNEKPFAHPYYWAGFTFHGA